MKLTLSTAEMLDLWRLHYACQPPLSDTVFLRNDRIDTSGLFTSEMNLWYRRLLLEASPSLLSPRSLDFPLPVADEGGATRLDLPAGVVRVLEVRLASWLRPATVVTDPASPLLLRQLHPFTRATPSSPLAFFSDGQLLLYPGAAPADSLAVLSCIIFEEDVYEFDDSALATLHPE